LFDWDEFVRGYLGGQSEKWKKKMKKMFAEKGYEADAFDYYTLAAEKGRGFLERNAFLF
jgi:tRNA(Glu) U13 pseudouridine synthase TruD